MSVAALLDGKEICVCGGAGGVGKTTASAAIALGMAAEGAKVAVVTIDPARRLANALGLQELGNTPRRVETDRLRSALAGSGGELEIRGELWAMMLDPKRTFDELIERLAPDPARAEEIKRNGVYRELSSAVSGSQEFTAISKLYELSREGDFDLLVLDTPPSRNALDFLDAPGRLTSFLDGRALRTFLRPSGLGVRLLGRSTGVVMHGLKRITGIDLIADLTDFFSLLGSMTEDFNERAQEVQRLLRADTTAFVLVTSAQSEPIDEAIWFRRTLLEGGLPFAGVVVNRVHHDPLGDLDPDTAERELAGLLTPQLGEELTALVTENLHDFHALARRDLRNIERLSAELSGEPVLLVPHLDDDVHDIEGLLRIRRYLFATDAERRQMIADVVA